MSNCDQLEVLNYSLFSDCKYLAEFIFPPNLKKISSGCFKNSILTTIKIPDSLEVIENYKDAYGLMFGSTITEVIIGQNSNLKHLGSSSFLTQNIKYLYIPRNLSYLYPSAISGCPIERIEVHPENENFRTDGLTIFTGENNYTLHYCSAFITGTYVVPKFVTTIYESAMRLCKMNQIIFHDKINSVGYRTFSNVPLTSFSFMKGITEVPSYIFNYCIELEEVNLTEEITIIHERAFYACVKLKKIKLPNDLQKIEELAFGNCVLLESVNLSANTILGDSAFMKCANLKLDTSASTKYFFNNSILFSVDKKYIKEYFGNDENIDIFIPNECVSIDKYIFKDKVFKSISFGGNEKLSILDEAFRNSNVQIINFPVGLSLLSINCFRDCRSLTNVSFDGNLLKVIPDYCFYNCPNLENIILPSSITSIGDSAFYKCAKLGDIGLENTNIESISRYAFYSSGITNCNLPTTASSLNFACFGLSSATKFSTNIETVPSDICKKCENLELLILNEGVQAIEDSAFEGCIILKSVTFPKTIKTIKPFAFKGCVRLNELFLESNSNLDTIYGGVFINCYLLKEIKLHEDERKFTFANGALTDYNITKLVTFLPQSDITTFIVPASMESINSYAFMQCTNLQKVLFQGIKSKILASKLSWAAESYLLFISVRIVCMIYMSPHSMVACLCENVEQ